MSTPSEFMWFTFGSTWDCRWCHGDHLWVPAAASAPIVAHPLTQRGTQWTYATIQ